MENLKDYSLADLDVLHEQMLKEEGYAGSGRKDWYAARIADIVNEKNSRLPDDIRANVMGGVVPTVYDNGTAAEHGAAVSAERLSDPTQNTPAQKKGADVNKLKG